MEGSWKTQTPTPPGASNKQTGDAKTKRQRQQKTPASYTAADPRLACPSPGPASPTLLGSNVNIKHKSQEYNCTSSKYI